MKRQSLQTIDDEYVRKGLRSEALRKAVEADSRHQQLIAERKQRLTVDRTIATSEEDNRYVLSTDQDYEILDKIHQLEARPFSDADHGLVRLIRTQLEADWRSPLIEKLNKLLGKYQP